MSNPVIVGGLFVIAFFALWYVTSRKGSRVRARHHSEAESRVTELRHVVTEMAMEKHDSRKSGRH